MTPDSNEPHESEGARVVFPCPACYGGLREGECLFCWRSGRTFARYLMGTYCEDDGPDCPVDEDGCCLKCGSVAVTELGADFRAEFEGRFNPNGETIHAASLTPTGDQDSGGDTQKREALNHRFVEPNTDYCAICGMDHEAHDVARDPEPERKPTNAELHARHVGALEDPNSTDVAQDERVEALEANLLVERIRKAAIEAHMTGRAFESANAVRLVREYAALTQSSGSEKQVKQAHTKLVTQLREAFFEVLPDTWEWSDAETAVDLLKAEIMALRAERDRQAHSLPSVPYEESEEFVNHTAREVICRVFDQWEPVWDRWLDFDRTRWLNWRRALGGFVRRELNARAAQPSGETPHVTGGDQRGTGMGDFTFPSGETGERERWTAVLLRRERRGEVTFRMVLVPIRETSAVRAGALARIEAEGANEGFVAQDHLVVPLAPHPSTDTPEAGE